MNSKKKVLFHKYHGSGNDFIVIEDYDNTYSNLSKDKVALFCNRNYGVGSDGFILIQSSIIADCRMRIFNADGLEASMCGNGLRCLIRHVAKKNVSIETNEGICLGENHEDVVNATLPVAEEILSPVALKDFKTGHLINTGVPHLIIPVNDIDVKDFEQQAKEHRYHQMFAPYGVNVSYMQKGDDDIFIRTYERGVEKETLACGTACAAAAFVIRKYETTKQSSYKIYPRSNQVMEFSFDSLGKIWMKGPATRVFKGEMLFDFSEKTNASKVSKRVCL